MQVKTVAFEAQLPHFIDERAGTASEVQNFSLWRDVNVVLVQEMNDPQRVASIIGEADQALALTAPLFRVFDQRGGILPERGAGSSKIAEHAIFSAVPP